MQTATTAAGPEAPHRARPAEPTTATEPRSTHWRDIDVETPDGWITGNLEYEPAPADLASLSKPELRRDLHQALAELARTQGELDKATMADRERRWSMAAAGHDLRQPLQVMLLALDSLVRRPERAPWIAGVLQGEIQRVRDGLDDLAAAARVAPEAMPAHSLGPVKLMHLLETVRDRWRPIARAKGLDLRIVRSNLAVLSDPALLSSIADNLVGNAIKYTSRGRVLVGCRRVAAQVRIEVIDTGVGFDPADLSRLAQPFCQGDGASEGLGLGLSLVTRAAHRLGHRLSAHSILGEGSRFALIAARAMSPGD